MLLAVTLDAVAGDPPNRWHPVAWIGTVLDRGRVRLARGSPARLLVGGGALTVVVALGAAVAAWGVAFAGARLGPAGPVLEAVVLASMLAVRGLVTAALGVARALDRGDVAGARARVGRARPDAGEARTPPARRWTRAPGTRDIRAAVRIVLAASALVVGALALALSSLR